MKMKIKKIFALFPLFSLGIGYMLSIPSTNNKEVKAEEQVAIWEEDFSEVKPEFEGVFDIQDDEVAYVISNEKQEALYQHDLKPEEMVESNNYRLSFDLKQLSTKTNSYFYIHFLGLSSTGASVFFSLEQNGTWEVICGVEGGALTTGNGAPTDYQDGSIIRESIDLTTGFAHVELVHHDTILEMFINGRRYLSSSLQNLGNDLWDYRHHYEEGGITGFLFHWYQIALDEPTYAIDNIRLVEELPPEEVYYEESVEVDNSRNKIFGDEISGTLLGYSSYSFDVTFTRKKDIVANQIIKLELCGLNGLFGEDRAGDKYNVNFGIKFNPTSYTPFIEWYNKGLQTLSSDVIEEQLGETVNINVLVLGDSVEYRINQNLVMDISFVNDLYIYKGPTQCAAISNSTAYVWTKIIYQKEADAVESVNLTANKNTIYVGDEVTFFATINPESANYREIIWKVNGSVIDGNQLINKITFNEVGLAKVTCTVDNIQSPIAYINVKQQETTPIDDDPSGGNDDTPNKKNGCGGNIGTNALYISLISISFGLILLTVKKKAS